MKIVCISDTHCMHDRIDVPDGDVLIHAGDFCGRGTRLELASFLDWIEEQPHPTKIVIAGNHDVCVMDMGWQEADARFEDAGETIYLEDLAYPEPDGPLFYGVPWTPDFNSEIWAFNYKHAEKSPEQIWGDVPNADVIISHGPPLGVLDRTEAGNDRPLGCPYAMETLMRVQPKLFVCGHIHGGYGTVQVGETLVVNASICTEAYEPTNKPIVVEL